ncbi:DNA binding protein [Mycobacterium phage ZenTime222]|nr:DNA binding protein [Mycobacterium phage ZenTime222]
MKLRFWVPSAVGTPAPPDQFRAAERQPDLRVGHRLVLGFLEAWAPARSAVPVERSAWAAVFGVVVLDSVAITERAGGAVVVDGLRHRIAAPSALRGLRGGWPRRSVCGVRGRSAGGSPGTWRAGCPRGSPRGCG